MEQLHPNEPFVINLINLTCHQTVSGKETDQVFLKHDDKRLYPTKGPKFIDMPAKGAYKFDNLSLKFPGRVDLDTVVIELWYKKNFFRNVLGGRFFFMLNISEIGFSATQLIRSSMQKESHYLLHWEMRSLERTPEKKQEEFKLRQS